MKRSILIFAPAISVVALFAAPTKMTRNAFKKLVINKNQKEVVKNVGKPDFISPAIKGGEDWIYNDLTLHPVTDQVDPFATVHFNKNGVATDVTF